MAKKEALHLFISTFTIITILSLVYLSTSQLNTFRHEESFNFREMDSDEVLINFNLSRRQTGSLKVGYLEQYRKPPQIGIFGNHQIANFTSSVFDKEADPEFFFNMWFADIALPELYDEILYLASMDMLPTELSLIHITTPNNDNGDNILNFGNELPLDLRFFAAKKTKMDNLGSFLTITKQFLAEFENRITYSNFIFSLFQGEQFFIINPNDCTNAQYKNIGNKNNNLIYKYLPITIRFSLGIDLENEVCKPSRITGSLMRDGAVYSTPELKSSFERRTKLSEQDNPQKIFKGDEYKIAGIMNKIAKIFTDAGLNYAFIIMPVYESANRAESKVNILFDKALSLSNDINLLDHRRLFLEDNYFVLFDHPGEDYYAEYVLPYICERISKRLRQEISYCI
jgi:hypothetical protein